MPQYTDPTNEKAPGATNTNGLWTNTNNRYSATSKLHSKALDEQTLELENRDHSAHQLGEGGFPACESGLTFYDLGFVGFQAFARKLEVNQ